MSRTDRREVLKSARRSPPRPSRFDQDPDDGDQDSDWREVCTIKPPEDSSLRAPDTRGNIRIMGDDAESYACQDCGSIRNKPGPYFPKQIYVKCPECGDTRWFDREQDHTRPPADFYDPDPDPER